MVSSHKHRDLRFRLYAITEHGAVLEPNIHPFIKNSMYKIAFAASGFMKSPGADSTEVQYCAINSMEFMKTQFSVYYDRIPSTY